MFWEREVGVDDEPGPPVFGNPFAWDGALARVQVQAEPPAKPDAQTLEARKRLHSGALHLRLRDRDRPGRERLAGLG